MANTIHQWKRFALIDKVVELPTGKTVNQTYVDHPGATVILPITSSNEVVLLRQYRAAIDAWLYELPAGTLEQGENPLTCAKRELVEESGFNAKEFASLGELVPAPGFCNEVLHLFVAKELVAEAFSQCDDDEVIEVNAFSLPVIEQMIIDGEITDAKTIACLAKAKLLGYLAF